MRSRPLRIPMPVCVFVFIAGSWTGSASAQLVVQNTDIAIQFAAQTGTGLTLLSIRDRVTGRENLQAPTFLFEFAVDNGMPYRSNDGISVTAIVPRFGGFSLSANGLQVPLQFELEVDTQPGEPAIVFRLGVRNTRPGPFSSSGTAPNGGPGASRSG